MFCLGHTYGDNEGAGNIIVENGGAQYGPTIRNRRAHGLDTVDACVAQSAPGPDGAKARPSIGGPGVSGSMQTP